MAPDSPHHPARWRTRGRTRGIVFWVASVLTLTLSTLTSTTLVPAAQADNLDTQRIRVTQQIAKTKGDLDESSRSLQAAAVAVDQAQGRLDGARAALDQAQSELSAARVRDAQLAAKLEQAQAALAAAKAAVAAGQAKLDAQQAMVGKVARDQYQQQTNLMPLAALLAPSTADLQTRLQWSTTIFDASQAKLDELTALQRDLNAERARQAELEAQVAADRRAAAADLVTKTNLEARVEAEKSQVAELLRQRQAIEAGAADEVAKDHAQYAQLTRERASVEHRIAVRIAKAKAEAARRAAAADRRAAAARRAAEQVAAQAAQTRTHSSRLSSATPRPTSSGQQSSDNTSFSTGGSQHHGFIFPVSAPITSPYGMRFHPVLHYWKLHDGTDFGAGCGTPIRAAYAGRVAERYFNAGYGNRLMIDHGVVDGRFVTTGYNHAIGYVVNVGQHVDQGQIIGYVGSTGFATGCHLHLMVWLDGQVVNPMTWF